MEDSYRPSPGGALLSTRHPLPFILAAVFCGFGGGMALALVRPVAAGLVVFGATAMMGSILLGIGIWSRHYPDEATRTIEYQQARRDQSFLCHPARWLVVFPPFAAVGAALRLHASPNVSHSGASWVVSAVGGYMFGLVLVGVLIESARRRQAAKQKHVPMSGSIR